ncbi:MAG TPA: hypothetical protein VHJ17_02455 [Thermomonospora sp.]|nr:hypothetical protein [Thermomonospora sp.]
MGMPPYPHDIAAELRDVRAMATDAWTAAQSSARWMPHLPMTFAPVDAALWPKTAGDAWVGVWQGVVHRQHPRLRLGVWCQGAAASGQCRVVVDGTAGTARSFGEGISRPEFEEALPDGDLNPVTVRIELRRSSGTGTVACWPLWAYGVES